MTLPELIEELTVERYGRLPRLPRYHNPTPAQVLAFEAMSAETEALLRRQKLALAIGLTEDDYKEDTP